MNPKKLFSEFILFSLFPKDLFSRYLTMSSSVTSVWFAINIKNIYKKHQDPRTINDPE